MRVVIHMYCGVVHANNVGDGHCDCNRADHASEGGALTGDGEGDRSGRSGEPCFMGLGSS